MSDTSTPSTGSTEPRTRDVDTAERLTEHEALMWNVEKDPWLNPSGASVVLLDQPIDMERFRRVMRNGVARMPRMYQRIVPGLGRLSTPAWAPDAEFDLDYHVREIELTGDGSLRELFDLASQLYSEPLDRTRPLWRFVHITGREGGKAALYVLTHHVIADGIGQLRMAELYQQLTRDDEGPDDIDLESIVAEAVAATDVKEAGGDAGSSLGDTVQRTLGHLVRRQVGIGRRVAGEVIMWPADPSRARETAETAVMTVRSVIDQLQPGDDDRQGSPLLKNRSRHRHLEWVSVPVAGLKDAAHAAGASLNDAFLAGLADGAYRYHAEFGEPVAEFNSSFVVSTRSDNTAGGNSFTPVPVQLPGGDLNTKARIARVHERTTAARSEAGRTGGIGGLSGVVNLLPTSVVTRTARAAAAHIDFATSNLRGAPFELYVAGAKVENIVAMGPVAATGANITALSHEGTLNIGIFVDPAAFEHPEAFARHVDAAFVDMIAELAPAPEKPKPKKKTAKPKAKAAKAKAKPKTKKTTTKSKKAES